MDSVKWYVWKPGKNVLRIVPGFDPRHCQQGSDFSQPLPEGARDHFAIEVQKASNIGPNGCAVFLDPNSPGPLESHIESQHKIGDEASAIHPKNRALFFVIDRDNEAIGPQCTDWSVMEYNMLLGIFADPEYGDIACPFNGTDLMIDYVPPERSNNGFAQWISIRARRNSSPITTDGTYWHQWLGEDLFETTGAGRPYSDEFIQACLDGTDGEFQGDVLSPRFTDIAQPEIQKEYKRAYPKLIRPDWPGSC